MVTTNPSKIPWTCVWTLNAAWILYSMNFYHSAFILYYIKGILKTVCLTFKLNVRNLTRGHYCTIYIKIQFFVDQQFCKGYGQLLTDDAPIWHSLYVNYVKMANNICQMRHWYLSKEIKFKDLSIIPNVL